MKCPFPPTIVAALALAALASAAAQESQRQRTPRVVLLASGQVLHGTVADEGDQALLTLGPGSQMRLPHDQIICTGRTLDDVFAFQHRRLAASDVAGRLTLARWCLRSQLPSCAGQVLVELVDLAPDDPRVASLEQQMRQQARHPAPQPDDEAHAIPPEEELKAVAGLISPASFDAYMRQIQPLLVNRCAASGCHGVASKSEFQLLRPLTGVKLTQRMTQRNLHAVLGQVDHAAPLASPLLAAATQPHATFAAPLVDEQTDRAEIAALRAWLESVAKKSTLENAETNTAPPTVLLRPRETPADATPPRPAVTGDSPVPPKPRKPTAADEFNRRYFPERFEDR